MMSPTFTVVGDRVDVAFLAPAGAEEEAHEEVPEDDLNPIFPELKEIAWGFGAFIVLAVLMRWMLFPRMQRGTEARQALIRSGHEDAEQITAAAQGDADAYEAQLASVRAEAASRIDAARATLEQERSERLAAVNAVIAERRSAAAAEVEAAKAAAHGSVETAVRDVAAAAGRLATGRQPDDETVGTSVRDVMSAGVTR
jgi:F-type H+-transporting ATPase subunit b